MGKTYDIETITLDEFRELFARGDDSHDNQIRVSKDGKVFLSQDIVGADQLENIAFRFESFDAYNDYVGEDASKDDTLVIPMFKALKGNWKKGSKKTYIDDWKFNNYDCD